MGKRRKKGNLKGLVVAIWWMVGVVGVSLAAMVVWSLVRKPETVASASQPVDRKVETRSDQTPPSEAAKVAKRAGQAPPAAAAKVEKQPPRRKPFVPPTGSGRHKVSEQTWGLFFANCRRGEWRLDETDEDTRVLLTVRECDHRECLLERIKMSPSRKRRTSAEMIHIICDSGENSKGIVLPTLPLDFGLQLTLKADNFFPTEKAEGKTFRVDGADLVSDRTIDVNDKAGKLRHRAWLSSKVPLGGLIAMELDTGKTNHYLIKFGVLEEDANGNLPKSAFEDTSLHEKP